MLVKQPRPLMQRMNENRADSRDLRRLQRAQDRIPQQGAAKPLALPLLINRQASHHHDRDRVRHVPPHPPRRNLLRNRASREAIIAHHAPVFAKSIRPGGSAPLIFQGAAFEPFIEFQFSGTELHRLMLRAERFRRTKPTCPARRNVRAHSQGAFVLSSLRSFSLSAGGASRRTVNSRKAFSLKVK